MNIETLIYTLGEEIQGKHPDIDIISLNATSARRTMILHGRSPDGTEITEEIDLYED